MDKRKVRRQLRVLFKDIKRHMDNGGKVYPAKSRHEFYTCLIVSTLLCESAYGYYLRLLLREYPNYVIVPFGESALLDAGYTCCNYGDTLQNPLRAAWINKLSRHVPKI